MTINDLKVNEIYLNQDKYQGIGLEQLVQINSDLYLKTIKCIENYRWSLNYCQRIDPNIELTTIRELTLLEKLKYL